MRAWNYRQHSGLVCVCLTILYTTMCPVEFNGSQTESSGQHGGASHHKDRRPTQQTDLWQLIWRLEAHLPLYEHYGRNLISLSSGIIGDSSVNCHNAQEVGQQLQQQMVVKRKVKAMTLEAMTSSIAVHGQEGSMSPQLLRMICSL